MKSHELKVDSKKNRTRAGRGIAAGRGKTAGRGTKGQNARSGGQRRPGFEGGQNPLYMRLPKLRGFKSKRTPSQEVTTKQLNAFNNKTANHEMLLEAKIIKSLYVPVKIVQKGDLTAKVTVKLDGASAGAAKQIKAAGGSFVATQAPKRPKTEK